MRLIQLLLIQHLISGLIASDENLALHRPYRMYPSPNYPLCSDPGDVTQLTDGEFAGPGNFWAQRPVVGWSFPEVVIVIIDLGKPFDFTQVKVTTAARPAAGVMLPSFDIASSEDDVSYSLLRSRSVSEPLTVDQNIESRFTMTINAHGHGRWIMVALRTTGSFIFSDEIEIYSRTEGMSTPIANDVIRVMNVKNIHHDIVEFHASLLAWGETIAHLNRLSDNLPKIEGSIADDLWRLKNLPFGIEDQEMASRIRSKLWSLKYGDGLHIWESSPWANVNYESDPIFPDVTEIKTFGQRGDKSNCVLSLSNATTKRISLNYKCLCKYIEHIHVLNVVDVLSRDGKNMGDALIDSGTSMEIPIGETRQIWIKFDIPTECDSVVTCTIQIDGDYKRTLTLQNEIFKAQNDPLVLSGFNWSYLSDSKITRGIESSASDDLRSHGVNVHIFSSSALPVGRFDGSGHLIGELDFMEMDRQLSQVKHADRFIWFFGWDPNTNSPDRNRFGQVWMTDQWKIAFREWMNGWKNHYISKGIRSDQVIYYPFDEYMGDMEYDIAREIKGISSDNLIFCIPNLIGYGPHDPMSQIRRLERYIDIWCPHRDQVVLNRPDILREIVTTKGENWMYQCEGPAKSKDSNSYYRLEWWLAFREGLTGAGFWSYNDAGKTGNAWDDCDDNRSDYSVIYTSRFAPSSLHCEGGPIYSSRRWEAWSQGKTDARNLYALKGRMRYLDDKKILNEVNRLLSEGVERVVSESGNAALAESHILNVLRILERIP